MMSSTTRSTGCSPKRCERLLAVGRLDDRVAVALEREAQHLADGLVVVDEQNGGGVGHGLLRSRRLPGDLPASRASYYSPEMAAPMPSGRRRRRPRRGSLARPVNGRLYRGVVPARARCRCSCSRSRSHARRRSRSRRCRARSTRARRSRSPATSRRSIPDRAPGSAGAIGAARLVRRAAAAAALRPQLTTDLVARRTCPGSAACGSRTSRPSRRASRRDVIVVMAHRDDIGAGPGANDNASGTAALIELARAYAQPQTEAQARVQSAAHASSSSRPTAAPSAGSARCTSSRTSPFRDRIVAVINLDAIAGRGPAEHRDRRRPPALARTPTLVATAIARIAEQTGAAPRHVGFFGQLVDLGVPVHALRAGPVRRRRDPGGHDHDGRRPAAAAFGDTAAAPRRGAARPARRGRAAAARLARPGPRARAEHRRATSGSAAGSSAAGRSSSS